MVKKATKISFFAAILVLMALVFACLLIPIRDTGAEAAPQNWSVKVARVTAGPGGTAYIDLNSGERLTENVTLAFLVSYPSPDNYTDNDTIWYYESNVKLNQNQLPNVVNWSIMSGMYSVDYMGTTYEVFNYEPLGGASKCNKYIYFKRTYADSEGKMVESIYTISWNIIINLLLEEEDLGIAQEDIIATYQSSSGSQASYTGSWINTSLRFTVTTNWMRKNNKDFDTSDELLFYSADGRQLTDPAKEWIAMSSNLLILSQSLQSKIYFKVTNISQTFSSITEFPYQINMDMATPTFTLSAVTTNTQGTEVSYSNKSWTSNPVYFTINRTDNCLSPVTYYYRTSTQPDYEVYNSSIPYPCLSSVAGLKFMARNAAGGTYFSEEYEVNIDNIRPVVSLSVFTEDPANAELTKPLNTSRIPITLVDADAFNAAREQYSRLYYLSGNNYVSVTSFVPNVTQYYYSDDNYYANGKIFFHVYNRSVEGQVIRNNSPLTYYYSVMNNDGSYSAWTQLTISYLDNNNYTYFYLRDSILAGISVERSYRFRIQSAAGLVSDEVEFTATLVNSVFSIDVEEIRYTANARGWASSPIPVYVKVPTDTKAIKDSNDNIIGYTDPTTRYIFYYAPVEVSNVLYSAEGECVENLSDGFSRYRFYLSASANSAFIVYATNLAGKASQNTYQSEDRIMIDTTLPQAWIEAFVMDENINGPTNIEVASGMWVNGSIYLTLKARIGISSIYAYRLYYVKDGEGNPIRDENGKIIWLDNSTIMRQDESVDGVAYYHMELRLPNQSTIKMTEYYGFRIYTGSGVYVDIEFVANIDTSTITLDAIGVSDNETFDPADPGSLFIPANGNRIRLDPVSKDFYIKLFANSEQAGHFDYLLYNSDTNSYENVAGYDEYIKVEIPIGKKSSYEGVLIRFYLVSKAVDYLGNYKPSVSYYEIEYHYNTVNITINYAVSATSTPGTQWKSGSLNISVGLQANENGVNKELSIEEKESYTYYYMLINYYGFVSENDALNKGTWIQCNSYNQGSYDIFDRYNFIIPFDNTSFYGYLALSVCNEAGFRSSSSGFVANLIRIDNTTPDVTMMINQTSGDNVNRPDEYTHTYFSKDAITIQTVSYGDRAPITYYYFIMTAPGVVPTENPVSPTDARGWTVLTNNRVFGPAAGSNYTVYKILLYAVNELGESDGGIPQEGSYTTFELIIDTSALTGALSYSPFDGGYLNSATGLWSYQWQDRAILYLSSENSNTQVSFWYSMDKGASWHLYNTEDPFYDAGTTEMIIFDENVFPQGVMATFSFKVRNRAGQEYFYTEDIYIAMDNIAPDFEIDLTVNGAPYYGGSTEFTDTTGAWSNVDINIRIRLTVANVSGARFTYKIYYFKDNTMKTAEEDLPVPNNESFSSYSLLSNSTLFPNRSGDIVLEITATNKKKTDKFTSHRVRLRIDKTVPTFELKGLASSGDSSSGVYVESGQWTNHSRVVVSKANAAKNASAVKYYLTYEDLTSTAKEQYEWDANNSSRECTQTCTITVLAVSEAGLEHTEVFHVKIDTIPPVIMFMGGLNVVEGEKHFIDLKVFVREENIKICQYITIKGEKAGFPLDPSGYVISTSSVDNSTRYDSSSGTIVEYRGYVKIYVEDYAGNTATFWFYMLPFELTVNNITLSNEDARTLEKYEEDLNKARVYMESSRVTYFENLIQRLKDRISTLNQEINGYRAYLEKLSQRISYELKSDYYEMFSYLETYNNYALYGQAWIQDAIKGDASSKYYAYYENLKNVFEMLDAQMQQVRDVENHSKILPAINVVEANDYKDVLRVFDEYNNLSADQKACFTTTLYTKILTLKKKCEVMLLTDADTGISVDGDFSPGAKIKITEFKSTSDYYMNAQSAIMSALTANDPRAIVSINRISLDGAASQTTTGTITVTLPIPEDWQQYIKFGVYKVSSDGTVSAIEKIEIQGDGKTLKFKTEELSTFVLCAKANIQTAETRDDVFGTLLGLEMDVKMIRNLAIAGAFVFVVVLVVAIVAGARHKRFLNTYNRAYRASRYRKSIQEIPFGNTVPRSNPLKEDQRVTTPKHPY
ncbi:MAG TPA: hypothetical protein PKY53_04985 [Clostridia bacterium]|nr:hypothetical protein [Clostridia bacterium]